MSDQPKLSKEDMQRALDLLAKDKIRKEKIARGEIKTTSWKDMTPEQKAKAKLAEARRQARIKLTIEKAQAAKITVTDAEVEAYIAAHPPKK